jgi:hypothetical protein
MESHTIVQDEQRTTETRASIYLTTPLPASQKPAMKFARATHRVHGTINRSVEMDESTTTLPFGQHGTQKTELLRRRETRRWPSYYAATQIVQAA